MGSIFSDQQTVNSNQRKDRRKLLFNTAHLKLKSDN